MTRTNTATVAAGAVPATLPRTATKTPGVARFADFAPRSDLMNTRHLHDHGHQPALRRHLGNPDTTLVLGEVPVAREASFGRGGVRVPDLLVAFDVPVDRILEQKGYAINEIGKPPDFVLEVASDNTSHQDETDKWYAYASLGIKEYWLFDPDWGQRYSAGLIGWTLENGLYRRIPIRQYAAGRHYGDSAILSLQVCWEHGALRWYDPAAGRYLDTFDSIAQERDEAVAEAQQLRAEIALLREGRA